ncbi:hypothetical protein PC9H_002309 [Pleurotus ostreatus]|uniref:Uncharacterized protein n=1 Tax=Pleurotus ostreatus TaxID=5322 RepID=A0A8H6ZLD7_PLEOS|nr:uncharacterized protein PC9H_002309 [Pleurotus ostreatus]KAF7419717.1 hypothetical protein PC9H_002309 [Pleurotus ostreatus]
MSFPFRSVRIAHFVIFPLVPRSFIRSCRIPGSRYVPISPVSDHRLPVSFPIGFAFVLSRLSSPPFCTSPRSDPSPDPFALRTTHYLGRERVSPPRFLVFVRGSGYSTQFGVF